jgi:hypothetical protein
MTFTVGHGHAPPARFKPGDRCARLTILEELPERIARKRAYRVQCDCGTIKTVRSTDMRSGKTRGCGCARGGRVVRRPKPTPAEIALAAIMRVDAHRRATPEAAP